ncbi:hypothetical protein [Allosediminivita pacifica]|uniref:Lipoprotein n=1 Tax=Allosediminivita pacifica TaxID=1267769 RepID=A0A2T6AJ62_9RHOB|nr:hypothetical protein [Allosediminivita pacifica]PTX43850.1 hypothetical protein C8N44_12462 [Allosediminivita pacifica]GGB22283.1 hypothetical protein GCM10011324_35400 [Allosediminivita pacifica]
MSRYVKPLALVAALGTLAACGETAGEQALWGAGAGATGALAVGGNPVTGAAVGTAGNLLVCQSGARDCDS